MILQLDPPIWLETPDGIGLAHLVERVSMEHSLYWTVFLESSGQVWSYPNEKVRAVKNYTLDRTAPEKPAPRAQSAPASRS